MPPEGSSPTGTYLDALNDLNDRSIEEMSDEAFQAQIARYESSFKMQRSIGGDTGGYSR